MEKYIECRLDFFKYNYDIIPSITVNNYINFTIDYPYLTHCKQYKIIFKEPINIDIKKYKYFDFYLCNRNPHFRSYNPWNSHHLIMDDLNLIYDSKDKKIYGIFESDFRNEYKRIHKSNCLFNFIIKYYNTDLNFSNVDMIDFKILELPFVILNNILEYLDDRDILTFKLISKKCLNIFQKSIRKPLIIDTISGYFDIYERYLSDNLRYMKSLIRKHENFIFHKYIFDINISGIFNSAGKDDIYNNIRDYITKSSKYIYSLYINSSIIVNKYLIDKLLLSCDNLQFIHIILNENIHINILEKFNNIDSNIDISLEMMCRINIGVSGEELGIKDRIKNNVKSLNVSFTDPNDIILLSWFKNLEYLCIDHEFDNNTYDQKIFEYISHLNNIKDLSLEFTYEIPDNLLTNFPKLYSLHINDIYPNFFDHITYLSNLKYIFICETVDNNILQKYNFQSITNYNGVYIRI